MKKKLFSLLVLLMVAVTGAWADITITWGPAELSSLTDSYLPAGATKTVKGITVTVNAGTNNFLAVSEAGTLFSATNDNAFTFSTELGNFTKIECTSLSLSGTLGDGWDGATWTGDANSVNMSKAGSFLAVSSITFTIGEPAEPVASWVGNSAINANGTWYYAGENFGWCTGGAFNGADLGTITTLSLGGQSQAWAEGNANWNDGNLTMTMGYKIDGGADESLSLNWFEFADNNNKFQSGGSSWAAQDIDISGLAPGNHTIAVWFTRDDKWDSNNSANYVANFTIPTPAATTYTVTVKEGTEDAEKWTADPNPAEAGQTVTVTYSGLKKVKSVKAKKAAPAAAAGIVNPVVGQIIGSDGKNYDANATLPTGVTAAGVVVYKDGAHGLALALTDEASTMNWSTANGTTTGAAAHTPTVTGQTWKLPSLAEWQQMFSANGGDQYSYTGLNTALAAAGGDSSKLQEGGVYWSSTERSGDNVYVVYLQGSAGVFDVSMGSSYRVRACLAF